MSSSKVLECLRIERRERVAEVVLSRPKALNALNRQMLSELEQVFADLGRATDLSAVILTGDGDKAFVAGADIAEMSQMTPSEAEAFSRLGHRVFSMVEELAVPVIAAVNGFALGGGCELALACDIIYASDKAKFGQPEVKLGLIPGFGGTVRLPRKIGMSAASEWIFTGDMYSAEQAKAVGLVREILPAADLLTRVRSIAETIAKRAPLAVQAAKRAMVHGLAASPHTAAVIEQGSFGRLFDSQDLREGTGAFLNKREPKFAGR